jgi:hypothetical protein
MLGGETGKITFGRIKYNFGLGATEFRFGCNILVQCVWVWNSGLSLLSLWLCLSCEEMRHAFSYGYNHIAALTLGTVHSVQLSAYINPTAVYA